MKQYCKELYPEGSPYPKSTALFYDHCALAYSNHRGEIDTGGNHAVLIDYSDLQWSLDVRKYIDYACDFIGVLAVVLYVAGYTFS